MDKALEQLPYSHKIRSVTSSSVPQADSSPCFLRAQNSVLKGAADTHKLGSGNRAEATCSLNVEGDGVEKGSGEFSVP